MMLKSILLLSALLTLSWALPQRSRKKSERLPRLTYSNFEERLLKIGVTPNDTDLPFAEQLPFQVLETLPTYKVVRFPVAKWICTREYRHESGDSFFNWRKTFDNDGHKATSEQPATANVMFKRLFGYILGVNTESTTVPVTKPIIQRRTPEKSHIGPEPLWKHELCFWAGSEYSRKELPGVLDDKIYIVKTAPFSAFVSRFGGYALSDADWREARDSLLEGLGEERLQQIDGPEPEEAFWSVAYDTPKKRTNRRNEVWIPIKEGAPVLSQPRKTLESIVMETKKDYELRTYGESTWICAKTDNFSAVADPLIGWQEKFEENPFKLFVSDTWKNSAIYKMHEKVKGYLYGVNSEVKKFSELHPILVFHKPTSPQFERQTLCAWLGDEYSPSTSFVNRAKQEPPTPLDPSLFVFKKEAHQAYAKKFGGYALSYQDFGEAFQQLSEEMASNEDRSNALEWVQAFYDPFFTITDRRNEVMIEHIL